MGFSSFKFLFFWNRHCYRRLYFTATLKRKCLLNISIDFVWLLFLFPAAYRQISYRWCCLCVLVIDSFQSLTKVPGQRTQLETNPKKKGCWRRGLWRILTNIDWLTGGDRTCRRDDTVDDKFSAIIISSTKEEESMARAGRCWDEACRLPTTLDI